MQTITILHITIALLVSVVVAYFQYFYKVKNKSNSNKFLFALKTASLFLIILLLINPKITAIKLESIKPVLSILVDNSKSMSYFEEEKNTQEFIHKLKTSRSLSNKFTIENFVFSNTLNISDSLSFSGNETNIHKALTTVNTLNTDKIAPILLLTDGNQTIGNDYEFINSKQKIYPIVFGDTTAYKDLIISQINVNKYSYLKNKFPVEVLLNYEGNETVKTKFSISSNGKTLFYKIVQFSKEESSQIITTNLTANKEGINYYTAAIQKVKNEKNSKNNSKNFSVEVISQQVKVLILTDVLHPDIGVLKKAIESNKQRSVEIIKIDKFKNQINDYQLVILYQPNYKFNYVLTNMKQSKSSFLLVTGANTDWNFINKQQLNFTKNVIRQTEDYSPTYNSSFLTFLQEDIGFNEFPALKDKFGEVVFSANHEDLLFQNINGLKTKQPLIAVLKKDKQKMGVIFGEGIWKWRASSYLSNNSFQSFDQFIGNLVQYVASKKKEIV